MSRKAKTIVLMVDAFRNDYLNKENTPFLYSLKKKYGLGKLVQPVGFKGTSGFFTGVHPKKLGLFSNYGFDGKIKKFPLSKILKPLPNKYRFYILNLLNYYKRDCALFPAIDINYFKFFKLKQKKDFFQKDSVSAKTFFDIFRENNVKFLFYDFPFIIKEGKINLHYTLKNNDEIRVEKFLKLLDMDHDFFYFHFADLDPIGHRYGPESREIKKALKKTDILIKKILSNFDFKKDNLIIWSDHGMVEIKRILDLKSKLPRFGEGCIYFLDSTMARFWFFNKKTKEKVLSILKKQKDGKLLSQEDKKKLGIVEDRFHGDEIFLADSGILIFPNFFNSEPVKGMHGYDLSEDSELAFFIINRPCKKSGRIEDLFPTLLKLMDFDKIPKKIDGKSLLNSN